MRPEHAPHSAWELLEHMRIAQYDILAFSGGAPEPYKELAWPDDYWPPSPAPSSRDEWARSVAACRRDLAQFLALVQDPERDLYEPFPWGEGQTLLREALLIADHAAYSDHTKTEWSSLVAASASPRVVAHLRDPQIAESNHISNPDALKAGEKLEIPVRK